MKHLFSALAQNLPHEHTVLVTVVASSGSTPRGAGARMLVSPRGLLAGTIGGGAVEHRCIAMAQDLMGTHVPQSHSFALNPSDTANLGMVCGGRVTVHFLPIPAGAGDTLALCREAASRFAAGTPFWLLTPLEGGGALTLWPPEPGAALRAVAFQAPKKPEIQMIEGREWFCEQLQHPGIVYLFGGGHVAQALVPVLAPLDFPCVVVEDREEFADPRLFPLARGTRLVDFSRLTDELTITGEDYVCIMTRGHQNDLLVQQQMLRTPARYIGLIGSARKAATAAASLRELGFSDRDLARIVTPIGLPIGGQTPAEIAISIAAQLIQYRARNRRDFVPQEESS